MENFGKHGKISSECEIANISPFGVWVLVEDQEYFLNHKQYPWFKGASVEEVLDVESPRAGHLRWPLLDIDLHIDSLKNPERYPLTAAQTPPNKSVVRTRKARRTR
jgi:Protein of unknown function (DUF2442)